MSVYTAADLDRPILVPKIQKTSPGLPQMIYRVSRGTGWSSSTDTSLSNPPELQRIGIMAESFNATLIDQPGSPGSVQYNIVAGKS